MNLYVVVEGIAEREAYRHWIPLVNANLTPKTSIADVSSDDFYLISGGGYPGYFEVIEAAIADVNAFQAFDRLVVSVDSEEMSFHEKLQEMSDFVSQFTCRTSVNLVIQHFCFETWALGNRVIVRPNTQSRRLRTYRQVFDVRSDDPEMLPPLPQEGLARAQFAEKYLIAALNDRFRNLTYTKSNPTAILHPKYFDQLRRRLEDTGHIRSFEAFLGAFV